MEVPVTPPAAVESTAPVTEGAPADAKPEAKAEEPRLAKAFAQLTQREKAILKREEEFKARERAMSEKYKPYEEEDQLWKDKKITDLLKRKGMSFDDMARIVLNDGKVTPEMEVKSVKEQLEALRTEIREREEAAKASVETSKKEEGAKAIENFKKQIGAVISGDPDRFELLNAIPHHVEAVYNKIDEIWQKSSEEGTPKLLTHEEAAEMCEKELEAEIEQKLLGLKKVKARFQSPEAAAQALAQATPAATASTPKTLTNALATSAPTPTKGAHRSREESIAEAAKLLRFAKG